MLDVREVNHPDDILTKQAPSVGLSKSFTVQDIFDAIDWHEEHQATSFLPARYISYDEINRKANGLRPGEFFFVGALLGESLSVDHLGKFRIGDVDKLENEWRKQSAVQDGILRGKKRREAMEKRHGESETQQCEHRGWVIREVVGRDRYLCKECNARFARHPQVVKPRPQKVNKLLKPVLDAMTEFRQGAKTFTKACEQASMSAEDFKKAITKSFPPKMIQETVQEYRIGEAVAGEVVVAKYPEPQRTSDPEEVEGIFTTPGVSQEDLMKIWQTAFPDVTNVEFSRDEFRMCQTMTLDFVDGTTQLIEISDKDADYNVNKGIF
tara:strand:+ start:134 stop:1105 length:972 start_codon:yes stop_codon:yes gene_type:complete